MPRVVEDAGLVAALVADDVAEEVELDLGVLVVVDPAVGAVDLLPAVIVEVRKARPPEPAQRIRAGAPGDVVVGAVAAVAQQGVAGTHLLEDAARPEPRLAHELQVKRHVASPDAVAEGV